jgi:hypothetical protein
LVCNVTSSSIRDWEFPESWKSLRKDEAEELLPFIGPVLFQPEAHPQAGSLNASG